MAEFTGATAPIPGTTPGREPGPVVQHRGRLRTGAIVVLVLAGLAGLAGGGIPLYAELTRHATGAEVAAAGRAEIATRWQRLPAGSIFPATVSYLTSDGLRTTARRVGIAPRVSCPAAVDPAAAAVLRRHGCVTVLRATYLDASGTLAVTVGVAVMPSLAAAQAAVNALPSGPGQPGLRAVRFPQTTAGLFGNAQRSRQDVAASHGSYAYFYAAGYTDGRSAGNRSAPGPGDLGNGVIGQIVTVLSGGPQPCARKDIRC
jgi:hypothetical protein